MASARTKETVKAHRRMAAEALPHPNEPSNSVVPLYRHTQTHTDTHTHISRERPCLFWASAGRCLALQIGGLTSAASVSPAGASRLPTRTWPIPLSSQRPRDGAPSPPPLRATSFHPAPHRPQNTTTASAPPPTCNNQLLTYMTSL